MIGQINMNKKKTVAVIFGGRSVEHDVSIITAHIPIIQSLLASGQFNVVPIYIAKNNSWYSDSAMNNIEYFRQPNLEERLKRLGKIKLSFDEGLKIVKPGWIPAFAGMTKWGAGMTKKIDVVFPAMHGTFGEDGSLMGLLRLADVSFVGCDLFASAVAMDKVLTKQVIAAENIPVVPYVWANSPALLASRLRGNDMRWPLFVKPVHLGSSIGMTKVRTPAELENAVEVAFHYDDKVLVEESIEDLTEVTLPIMGNNELQLAAIERPLNKTEFFDFKDKYLSSGKKGGGKGSGVNSQYSELPAKISEELAERVKELGKKTYRVLGCSGMARIDFLIDNSSGQVYVNEVNTLPGSLYHHNWKSVGVSNVELVTKLIELAEERFQEQKKLTSVFKSEVLKNT